MTPIGLRDALFILGWDEAKAAKHLGVTHDHIARWLDGRRKIPGEVEKFIDGRVDEWRKVKAGNER